jgi:hypothetical protein
MKIIVRSRILRSILVVACGGLSAQFFLARAAKAQGPEQIKDCPSVKPWSFVECQRSNESEWKKVIAGKPRKEQLDILADAVYLQKSPVSGLTPTYAIDVFERECPKACKIDFIGTRIGKMNDRTTAHAADVLFETYTLDGVTDPRIQATLQAISDAHPAEKEHARVMRVVASSTGKDVGNHEAWLGLGGQARKYLRDIAAMESGRMTRPKPVR